MSVSIIIPGGEGFSSGGSGSVTSVALTAAPSSVFNVSGSPVTTSGTLALSMDNQSANTLLAGPATGSAAAPAFRALVAADLPAGTGDVVGPASAVDDSIPTFDGTTGKLIQDPNGAKIISGAITSPGAGSGSEHFGLSSAAAAANGVAIGKSASAGGASADGSIAIGHSAIVSDHSIRPGIAIGAGAQALGGFDCLAIGGAAICNNGGCVVIGAGSQDLGSNAFILGNGSLAGDTSMAFGNSALATNTSSVAFGKTAATTADNQVVFGSSTAFGAVFKDIFFGNGVQNAAPVNMSLNATSGTGTNIAGASMTLNAGRPTGSGAGGDLIFQTSEAGGSGTTLRSLTERMRIVSNGNIGIGISNPDGARVSLYGSVATTDFLAMIMRAGGDAVGNTTRVRFVGDGNGGTAEISSAITVNTAGSASAGNLVLRTATGSVMTDRLTILDTGQVGIGANYSAGVQLLTTADAAGTIGQMIRLAGSPVANAFEINSAGGSGGDLYKIGPTGKVTFPGTSTTAASFNLPVGTAPTSPGDGDVWLQSNTTTGLKVRLNGVTETISLGGSGITALTGDVTASGSGSVAATIANLAVTNAKIANATIDLTTKVTGVLPINEGGTNSSSSLNNNRIIISSGSKLVEASAITNNSALISNGSGIPTHSVVLASELAFVSGVTSNIQTQLNAIGPQSKFQKKVLSGNFTGPATNATEVTDLTFTTLTIGKVYKASLTALTSASGHLYFSWGNGSDTTTYTYWRAATLGETVTNSVIFVAAQTGVKVYFSSDSGAGVLTASDANNAPSGFTTSPKTTYLIIEELNNYNPSGSL